MHTRRSFLRRTFAGALASVATWYGVGRAPATPNNEDPLPIGKWVRSEGYVTDDGWIVFPAGDGGLMFRPSPLNPDPRNFSWRIIDGSIMGDDFPSYQVDWVRYAGTDSGVVAAEARFRRTG